LFLTDYIATGRVVPERIAAIVQGIAEACVQAGCALVGGETAEHPGLLGPDEYDLAGSTTGVVEAADLLGPGRVRAGDVVVAMGSSGLHANGYSLVRHVLLGPPAAGGAGWSLDRQVDELGRTLGEELLEPTVIYAKACLDLTRTLGSGATHALSHVTGGGLAGNLERVLPDSVVAVLDRGTWTPHPVFDLVRRVGSVPRADLERTLNCGIGMVAVTAAEHADRAVALLRGHGLEAWVCGVVTAAEGHGGAVGASPGGSAALTGSHPGWS
jgi:phosphoribosylformylglycinamidine cyclo-ligase